jgi:predicted dehydrogenase
LANFTDLPGCKVAALAEIRAELGRRVASRYGVERVYASHEQMLAKEKLDAIVASQPYQRHGQILPELYDSGVPVFTEKPLGRSVGVGEALVKTLTASGNRHYLGYHKRSDPAVMYAVEQIRQLKNTEELGKLRYVRIVMPPGDWLAGGFTHLLKSTEEYPQLPVDPPTDKFVPEIERELDQFVNYYIHQVNLMRHLMQENYSVSYVDPAGVVIAVHSVSGVPGTIETAPYNTTVDWQEEALIAFEKGFLKLQLPAPMVINRPGIVTILRDPGGGKTPETIKPHLPWVHAMRQQAVNLLAALRGQQTPLCTATEALEDLRIAHAYIERKHSQ